MLELLSSPVSWAIIVSGIVFTCVGFYWGFYSGSNTTIKVLADNGYVKHNVLETGKIELIKLNEE